ncbi:MAG: TonB-dependent receptor plug domain-containing protein [Nitrosospira sp.]|nr:TonB-dependent receptor plug domain-containing protein [Nitrosospira sp.]
MLLKAQASTANTTLATFPFAYAKALTRPDPLVFAVHLTMAAILMLGFTTQIHAQTPIQTAAPTARIHYDIPAGPLGKALNRLAQQSGIAIAVDADKIKELTTQSLSGNYTVEEGLGMLLRNSGYTFEKNPAGYALVQAQEAGKTAKPVSASPAQETGKYTGAEPISPAPSITTLPPVVVVANPVIEGNRLDAFSTISSVVTQAQLRDQNALDLASALRRTPGVQISRFNPVGSFGGNEGGAIFIRGMGASRPGSEIKTYVDGVPMYLGVWGHPVLDMLPINGMQSITVYKSPQPQINGNNFASVNLETKRATEDGIKINGRVAGGYFSTFSQQADITGKFGRVDFMLAQGYARSNGHRPNADGELKNVMGRIGLSLNDNWSVGTNFLYVNSTAGDPGDNRRSAPAVAPRFYTEAAMFGANLSHKHGDWQGELRIYTNIGHGKWLNQDVGSFATSPFDRDGPTRNTISRFQTSGVRWKETVSLWKGSQVVGGVDNDWISGSVSNDSLFGMTDAKLPTFSITMPHIAINQTIELGQGWALKPAVGMRYYNHSQFGTAVSPHAGLSLVSEKITVYGNISRGVNYPGQEVAALTAIMPFIQNGLSLSPEKLEHVEVGVKLSPSKLTQVDVSLFHDTVKNRYVFASGGPSTAFLNLGTYTVRGAEISVRQSISQNWSVFGGLTLLDPSINNLPFAPKRAVTAGVNGKVGPVRLVVDAQHQSDFLALNRSRDTATGSPNTTILDGFTLLNARISHPIKTLGKAGEIFIAAENLLGSDYGYRPGYPMPGRWGQIGLSASF